MVCDKPEFHSSRLYQNATTAVLQFTFKVCYDPDDELVKFKWLKDNKTIDSSNAHYTYTHNQVNDSLYVSTLVIHNVTVNDSGIYSYQLWYNNTMINSSTSAIETRHLKISSKSKLLCMGIK